MIHSAGLLAGIAAAAVLVFLKLPLGPALAIGAFAAGMAGGGGAAVTGAAMASGVLGMLPAIGCVLASGVLAGAMMKTGAAERIAGSVISCFGRRGVLPAMAAAAMLLTASGVFVDIVVMTVAPIALAAGERAEKNRSAMLLAMIGGGKAGNLISPNPNTIAAAEAFSLKLPEVMLANLLPAFCALAVTILLASGLRRAAVVLKKESKQEASLPSLPAALSGPCAALALLLGCPLFGITVSPMLALPIGGAVCLLASGKIRELLPAAAFGIRQVLGVTLILLGTGALAGVLQASDFQEAAVQLLTLLKIPPLLLAPVSGILLGGAAASTTAGTAIAAKTFGSTLTAAGIAPLSSAAMIHAGAVVLDSLPHGSFFHATAGCAGMPAKERLRLIPFEALIGLTAAVVSCLAAVLF